MISGLVLDLHLSKKYITKDFSGNVEPFYQNILLSKEVLSTMKDWTKANIHAQIASYENPISDICRIYVNTNIEMLNAVQRLIKSRLTAWP